MAKPIARRPMLAIAVVAAAVLAACTGHSSTSAQAAKGECGLVRSPLSAVSAPAQEPKLTLSANARGNLDVNAAIRGARTAVPVDGSNDLFVSTDNQLARVNSTGKALWSLQGDIESWAPTEHEVVVTTDQTNLVVVDAASGRVVACRPTVGALNAAASYDAVPQPFNSAPPSQGPLVTANSVDAIDHPTLDNDPVDKVAALKIMDVSSVDPDEASDSAPDFDTAAALSGSWDLLAAGDGRFDVLGGDTTSSLNYTQLAFVGDPERPGQPAAGAPRVENKESDAANELSVRDYTGPVADPPALNSAASWDGLTVLGIDGGVTLVRDHYKGNSGETAGGIAVLDRQGNVLWKAPAADGAYAAMTNGAVVVATVGAGTLSFVAHNVVTGAIVGTGSVTDPGLAVDRSMLVSAADEDVWLTNPAVAVDVSVGGPGGVSATTVNADPSEYFIGVGIAPSGSVALRAMVEQASVSYVVGRPVQ